MTGFVGQESSSQRGSDFDSEVARGPGPGKQVRSSQGADAPAADSPAQRSATSESPRAGDWPMTPGLSSAFGLTGQSAPAPSVAAVQRKAVPTPAWAGGQVQAKGALAGDDVTEIAARGVAGASSSLPHLDTIQRSFGSHDVSGVRAHVGGEAEQASRAIGAEAYATGNHVAFARSPDLHTAAHEAAHVVQQSRGVSLYGGVGQAGDAHEQHADAVADAVVAGRSAQGLLDQYSSGASGGRAVQRQEAPGGAKTGAGPNGPTGPTTGPTTVDPKPIIAKLDAITAPTFAGASNGTFSVDALTTWMETLAKTLEEAKAAAASGAPPELSQAVDRCITTHGPALTTAATEVRTATLQLANDSSVAKKDPTNVVLPTAAQAKKLGAAAGDLNRLARDPKLPGEASTKATLQTATTTAQDAALAIEQSLSVVAARDRWKTGTATETPSVADAGKGKSPGADAVFKDSGFGNYASVETREDGSKHIFDWCGMFVASSYFTGPGLASGLRAGFYHVSNVKDFFNYTQNVSPDRVPMAIWAEGQWWNLKDYHLARGSARKWTPRATIQAEIVAGRTGDIRPGDTCLIDHGGGNAPTHIVMVESYNAVTRQLVTIEGNTYGIHADSTGKAERVDDDHLKSSAQGSGTATGLHVRDMTTLAPPPAAAPGTYYVTSDAANVRDDGDITKFKKVDGKAVVIPKDSKVEVTELKDVAGAKYANVKDWGWTKLTNLATSAKPPAKSYDAKAGATIWGVGRPSVVDFEDGHHYSVSQVPAELKNTSPDEIKELAKKKGKEGDPARSVKLK